MLQFYLVSNCYAISSALEGGVINFQGLLVNEKGVPYGTNTPETFIMRFSITSEDTNFIPWNSNPIEVEVIDGLFSVRLGKFDENVEALDSSIFTGNDDRGRRRFLRMEVCTSNNLRDCTPYNARNYRGFFQKDSNQNFSPTVVDSQIPVPGVPFVVSAVRVVGDDTKEGTLRISKDLDSDSVANDLIVNAQGSYSGLRLIHNQNVALFIYQRDSQNRLDALVTQGKGSISGSVYLRGANSNVKVLGKLESKFRSAINTFSGQLQITGKDKDGYAVQAGPIRSPVFKNPDGVDFQVSTTGLSRLHRVKVIDVKWSTESRKTVKIDSSGSNVIQIDSDGDLELSKQGFLEIYGRDYRKLDVSSASSIGIEAIGFYDNYNSQLPGVIDYPYQIIPHGLSVINSFQMGDSPQLSFKRLEGLIGNYDFLGQEWRPLSTVYIDDRTDAQTHKHDIKIGADQDNLVRKLNEDGEKRIIKRRVDSELAYKFDNNDGRSPDRPAFSNINYFYQCSSEELILKPIKCA